MIAVCEHSKAAAGVVGSVGVVANVLSVAEAGAAADVVFFLFFYN